MELGAAWICFELYIYIYTFLHVYHYRMISLHIGHPQMRKTVWETPSHQELYKPLWEGQGSTYMKIQEKTSWMGRPLLTGQYSYLKKDTKQLLNDSPTLSENLWWTIWNQQINREKGHLPVQHCVHHVK